MARSFLGQLRAEVATALEYRARILIWILTSIFPLLMLAVWLSVEQTVGDSLPWSRQELIGYYVGAAVISKLTESYATFFWDEDMRSGNLSFRLLKPLHPFFQYLARDLSLRMVMAMVLVPAAVVITLAWGDLRYDLSVGAMFLVVGICAGGFLLNVLISLTFATIGFWSTQMHNLYSLWWGAGAFLSGWIAPTELLPEPVRVASLLLPFRPAIGLPLDILVGRASPVEVAQGVGIMLLWLVVCWAGLIRLWRTGIRRYQAVGG